MAIHRAMCTTDPATEPSMPTVTVSLVALLLHMGWARDLEVRNLEGRLRAAEDGLQRLKYVLEELRREYEATRHSLSVAEEDAARLDNQINKLQALLQQGMVAFSASLHSGKIGPLPTATTLIYDDVLTNYGQAYDSDKGTFHPPYSLIQQTFHRYGTFTAPVGGVYYLTFKANAPAGSALAVSLVKNDGVQCSVYGELGGDAGSGAVLALRKGDRVVTRLSSNSCVEGDEKRRTGFGGFLLFPTA
ncbi:uncharacterized protein LOC114793778 [Denticeps clupeoides]|uniref:uncharacterized protein LOC114793778 n=1 Tax=Denticeps clupeoides TaxID=299321 RepID=UPI0010A53DAE|nr:uncharacterized protein LOC114793778 [Denticeps clupeoides]